MKQTAQGLAALGRGPDTELVHMAPGEVAGLQALAKAHGGSLTINPDTGLPEAGILSSILPMVIGAGLMASGIGAPMAGMLVGGGTALATGSLEKGLMAGLGAYGGAGLTEGLMGAGASSLSAGAGAAAEVPIGAIVPEAVAPAANMAANNVSAGLTAANEAQLVAANAAPAGAYAGPSSLAEASNFATSPYTATQMPVSPAAPAPTGPVPTMSPTGDFARFDRALSPGLSAGPMDQMSAGLTDVTSSGSKAWDFAKANKYPLGAMGISALGSMEPEPLNAPAPNKGMIRPYTYSRKKIPGAFVDVPGQEWSSKERRYFDDAYTPGTPYKAPGPEYMASGGTVEEMSNANAIGANTGYPQSNIRTGEYATPYQRPVSQNLVTGVQEPATDPSTGQSMFADGGSIGGYSYDPATGQYAGGTALGDASGGQKKGLPALLERISQKFAGTPFHEASASGASGASGAVPQQYANSSIGGYAYDPATGQYVKLENTPEYTAYQAVPTVVEPVSYGNSDGGGYATGGMPGYATGGVSDLGSYSDGGRLLRGPGDGVSDSIPAMIGQKQQARLADGEFVVPARIVSELGNGSTEAGARQLYAMMDRVQKNRKKSIGKGKVATDSKSSKLLPA